MVECYIPSHPHTHGRFLEYLIGWALTICFALLFNHVSLASFLWDIGKQSAASDQGLHCLLTELKFEN